MSKEEILKELGMTEEEFFEAAKKALDDVATCNEKIKTLESDIATDKATFESEKETWASEKATLEGNVATLNTSVESLNVDKTNLAKEKEALEGQILDVRSEVHKSIAKQVALAMMFSKEIKKEELEANITTLTESTDEVLAEKLNGIVESFAIAKPEPVPSPLDNPPKPEEPKEFNNRKSYEDSILDFVLNDVSSKKRRY